MSGLCQGLFELTVFEICGEDKQQCTLKTRNKKSLFSFPCLVTDTPWVSWLPTPAGYSQGVTASKQQVTLPGRGKMGYKLFKAKALLIPKP